MLKRSLLVFALTLSAHASVNAARDAQFPQQPPLPGPRIQQPPPGQIPPAAPPRTVAPAPRRRAVSPRAAAAAAESAVRTAFDTLVDGIRRADVETVMSVYWNSPQLVLFNNNGTVTRSWEQVRTNRAASYPNLKDVKLDVRDVRVRMLGADAAVVTCLWTQSQTARGQAETATGRLSLVFQKIGGAWKIVHTHTSPDRPDPSLIPPSERTTEPAPAEPESKPEPKTESKPPVKP